MTNPTAPAPLTFLIVADGHTAAEATWVLDARPDRETAMSACDAANITARVMGSGVRWHIERTDDVPTTLDAVTGVFSATCDGHTVTLTPPTSRPITDDSYWTERRASDGRAHGDAMGVRLRGEDPADYVARHARGIAAARQAAL